MSVKDLEFLTGKSISWMKSNFRRVESTDFKKGFEKNDILLSMQIGFSEVERYNEDGVEFCLYTSLENKTDNYYAYDIYDCYIDNNLRFGWKVRATPTMAGIKSQYINHPKKHSRHSGWDLSNIVYLKRYYIYTGFKNKFINWVSRNPLEEKE